MVVYISDYDINLGEENKTVTNKHTLCHQDLISNVRNFNI